MFTGQGPSIGNNFYIPGTIKEGDSSDITDDSYNYFKEDVRRIKALRVKDFLFLRRHCHYTVFLLSCSPPKRGIKSSLHTIIFILIWII